MDCSEMLVRVEKYACTEEECEVHGPPSSLLVGERPSTQGSQLKKEDRGRGRWRT